MGIIEALFYMLVTNKDLWIGVGIVIIAYSVGYIVEAFTNRDKWEFEDEAKYSERMK